VTAGKTGSLIFFDVPPFSHYGSVGVGAVVAAGAAGVTEADKAPLTSAFFAGKLPAKNCSAISINCITSSIIVAGFIVSPFLSDRIECTNDQGKTVSPPALTLKEA
jgi:hypothetical protein